MADQQYTYAVARVRSRELGLLNKNDIDQLVNCKTEKECLRLLEEKGWGKTGNESATQLLAVESEKIWDFMRELVEDIAVFDTFLYSYDLHNLKAAIKQVYSGSVYSDLYFPYTTVKPERIYQAVKSHDFSSLPEHIRAVAEEAYQIQMHTGDSQLCDIVLDRYTLELIYKKGQESGNDLLELYSELRVASSNINIAIRSLRAGKDIRFIERALVECASLDRHTLARASAEGEEAIYEYLLRTTYADAVNALKTSIASFECWCDNLIINQIKPQKYHSFSLSPLAAFILARENEIKTVRIILTCKRNEISDDFIRERLREMYV